MRRLALPALVLGALVLGTALPAVPSSASTYYDYWGYWHKPVSQQGAGAWQYSKVGASGYYLQPGAQVEGWRYAIGTASQSDPKPRPVDVAYGDYCHDTTSAYRVLLVVDYGTQSGAPSGPVYSCYSYDKDHQPSGVQVLTRQHTERDSGGLICAIDTYPKTGCGDVVSSPAPKPTARASTPKPSPSASPTRSAYVAPVSTSPAAAPNSSGAAKPSRPPTTTASSTTAPPPVSSQTIVAKQFVPPHRRGGVPYGFVAAGVFVVALVGAVVWQRRRRAG